MNKADDLSSEFEFDSQETDRKRRRLDLTTKHDRERTADDKTSGQAGWDKEDRKQKFLAIDPFSRHKLLVNEYLLNQPGTTGKLKRDTSRDCTDIDVIRANHKFLWDDECEGLTWGARLAKRYYDKLFKEYCISDLSRYKENQIAMRWRTEPEVISGKGQFICGNKKCSSKEHLTSWEVNFSYMEDHRKKNALVKLRLCSDCSNKLNYKHKRNRFLKESKASKVKKDPSKSPERRTSSTFLPEMKKEPVDDEVPSDAMSSVGHHVWEKPIEIEEEKKREDEFADFLDEMFF